jgi:hypothetical protein
MDKNQKVIPFPSPASATPLLETQRPSRVIVHIGQQRFAMNFSCHTTALAPAPAPLVAQPPNGGTKVRMEQSPSLLRRLP